MGWCSDLKKVNFCTARLYLLKCIRGDLLCSKRVNLGLPCDFLKQANPKSNLGCRSCTVNSRFVFWDSALDVALIMKERLLKKKTGC